MKNKESTCKDRKTTIMALILCSQSLPTGTARELFKPSEEAKHLGSVLKNRALLSLNIFWCDIATSEVWKFLMTKLGFDKKIKLQFKCFLLKYTE